MFRASLREMRAFIAVYEEESFSAAGVRNSVTQSGISRYINQLEALMDVTLFNRDQNGVRPTRAADILYRHAVEALRDLDAAAHEVSAMYGEIGGEIRLGAIPSLTSRVMAPALREFSELYPNVKVHVVEAVSSMMPPMIRSGDVNFAFAFGMTPDQTKGIRRRSLLKTTDCLLTARTAADQPQVFDQPLNLIWASNHGMRRLSFLEYFRAQGIQIGKELEVDSPLTVLDLIGRGGWSIISPSFILDPQADSERFVVWPLQDPNSESPLVLLESASRSIPPEGEALIAIIVRIVGKIQDAWLQASSGRLHVID